MKPKFRSLVSVFAPLSRSSLIICASLCAAGSAYAQSSTWTSLTSGGNWSDVANWNNGAGPVADGSGNTANFSTLDLPAGTFIVNLVADRTIGNIDFGDTDPATAGVWQIAGTNILTLAGAPTITTGVNSNILTTIAGASFTKAGPGTLLLTGANTISGTVQLNAGQITVRNGIALGPNTNTLAMANGTTLRIETTGGTSGSSVFVSSPISVAAASSVTMTSSTVGNGYSGLISGDASSVFNVGGTVTVSYSLGGSVQQFGGFLGRVEILDGASARFSQTSGVNNGSSAAIWDTNTNGFITTRNTGTVNLGSVVGTGTLSGSSGADGTGTFAIGGRNEDCTFDGSIISSTAARNSAVTKVGTAALTLTSATGLTYAGTTTVANGTLVINGIKSGTGAVNVTRTVENGSTTAVGRLAGSGSIAGTTTMNIETTLAPGDPLVAGGIGTLTLSSLSLATGSNLDLQFGSGNDKVVVSAGGTLTLGAGVIVNVNNHDVDGSYTIIDATGATVNGSASSAFTLANNNPSKIYSFINDGGAIKLIISSTDPSNIWVPDGGGSWASASNWTKGVVPNAIGAIAKVGPGPGGTGGTFSSTNIPIALNGNKTVGLLSLIDDFEKIISIEPGTGNPSNLVMDNGTLVSEINVTGGQIINAPVVVDAQGLAVTSTSPGSLTLNGVVSGTGATLTKYGTGNLVLNGNNTYDGGTTIAGGLLKINSATSLGPVSVPATFSGGTLQIGVPLTGITRSYRVTGANNALIDTNSNDFSYDGVISPVGSATGGLSKSGLGTMTLTGVQTYTGATAVNSGILSLASPGSIHGTAVNTSGGGSFQVDGGSFTITGTAGSSVNASKIIVNSGSATFAAVSTTSNTGDGSLIGVNGGTFNAASVTIHRTYNAGANLPTTVPTASGFVVANGTANVTGGVAIGTGNSSASALVSGGSLTVGGQFTVGSISTGGRYCTLQVTGGSFTSTDAINGLVLSTPAATANSSAVLLNGGTSSIERISFGDGDSAVDSIGTLVLDGPNAALYVGTGGIVQTSPNAFTSTVNLSQGLLGAKANWSSPVAMNLTGVGALTIKAADAAGTAHGITLSGVLGGVGGFEKTGAGTLTLSGANIYAGTTTITEGQLAIAGNQSGAIGDVSVASDAALGGNGDIGGNVTVASGGRQSFPVSATPGVQPVRHITGTLTLTGATLLDLTSSGPVSSGVYTLATASSIIGTPPVQGNYNGLKAVISVTGGNTLVVTITASDFDTWISGYTFAAGANLTPTGDPDGDGLTNQQEYAFGLIPNSGSSVNPITSQLNKATGLFTYTRRKPSLTGLTYVYQYSTTLGSWTAFTPTSATSNNGDPVEAVTVQVPNTLLSNGKLFVRVTAQ